MENTAYWMLGIVAAVVAIAIAVALIVGLPYSILGILVVGAMGLLFWKVVRERLANAEDDHYSKNVDR